MNLLAKIKNCGILMLGLAIFNSCEEKGEFGIATDDVAPVEFSTVDVPVGASMVLMDSIITSDISIALFGQLNNSPFGNPVSATGYIGLAANVLNQPDISDDAVLDSVQINFKIGYLIDTALANRALSLELYPIAEEFYDTTYINTNSLAIGDELLASGQFQIDAFDSVYVMDVTEDWATEFFEGVRTDDSKFISQDEFEAFFPGFAIKANAVMDNNIYGIQTGSTFELAFYYSEPNADNTETLNKEFSMSASGMPNFYNVTVDRSGSSFESVVETGTEYETSLLGVHAGEGLVPKVDFSGLEEFSNNFPEVIVNLAEITIGPIEDFPDGEYPPFSLSFYMTDERNTRIPDRLTFRSIQEDGANPLSSSSPVRLFYDPDKKTYSGSITSFVKAYQSGVISRNDFFVYPSLMNSSLNGFTFSRDNLKLKIFYSEVN
jgi:hypothetical protein